MFNKMLFSYMTLVIVLVLVIGSSYLMIVSHDIKSELQRLSHAQLSNLMKHADSLIQNVEQHSLQISLKPELNAALNNPYHLSIVQIGALKDQLKEEVGVNPLLYSIYVYFRLGDRVLTTREGLYPLDHFFDRQLVVDQFQASGSKGFELRRLYDSAQNEPVDLLTFHRHVPLTAKEPLGELILNVNRQAFFDTLFRYANIDPEQTFIVDSSSSAVLSVPSQEGKRFAEAIQMLASGGQLTAPTGLVRMQWEDHTYLLSYIRSDTTPWMVVERIPYSVYLTMLAAKLHSVLEIAGAVLLIGIALACLFSIRFTRPWKNIVRDYVGENTAAPRTGKRDESELIAEAIRELVLENRSIKHTLEQSEPIIRYRLIYDILTNRVFEASAMAGRLQHLGIVFPHPYYAAVIVQTDMQAYEERDDYNEVRLMLFSIVENELKKGFFVVGTILENDQLGFILNVPTPQYEEKLRQELQACCREAGHWGQDRFGITLQTAFGGIYPSMKGLNKSYHEAKRAVHNTAWTRRADCVFFDDSVDSAKWSYPLSLQKELLQRIKSADREQAKRCLDELFDEYLAGKAYTRDTVQDTVTLMMSAIVQELYEDGYLLDKLHVRFQAVNECTRIGQVKELFYGYISEMITLLEPFQDPSQSNSYVSKAVEYMHSHYDRIESISDVAEVVGVSSSYLSRMFRAETGKAPLDYLTRLRIDKSKELLFASDCKYSLQEICGRIGYHDVQSYIRFFKKWEHMTPGEYRKLQLDKGGVL